MCQSPQNRPLIEKAITFYGAGSMAEAIVRGLISRSVMRPEDITMLNRSNTQRLQELLERYDVQTSNDPEQKGEILKNSPVIVLAMKPKEAAKALKELGPLLTGDQLIISFIAGLSIQTAQSLLGHKQPIARTMPNTSCSIGLGSTGVSFSKEMNEPMRQLVMTLFEAVGNVTVIEEDKMDILTGISGSGPAYFYYMMEAMTAAGIRGGLTADQSRELTLQTIMGAARMVQVTGEQPSALRAKITSPNGSTQAALERLDQGDFFETVIAAVNRCAERSREMGTVLKGQIS
ncbi:pyrroline-5-carboxylate reductase [Paenibacillus sp. DMB20]|uniref:pyrroline-5-carboxylate reductase n=1 Tax=Paenibacillus sp. DMB20 TaxID=1642570 RepID=UPI00062765AA|nr:pyrroline-5-carboxylate reductase [Paenibacillus sp. DMB20]KKO51899.1 pyrroline-5-carboxylate reductase [Paenibacillus sp. DMB20]